MSLSMNKNGQYNLIQSFSFAFYGIWYALCHERNLRIHFLMGAYMLFFSRYYDFTRTDYALLLLIIGLVITCELFNTAIEKTVDLKTTEFNSIAKIAKDVAAGAVLVAALTSIVAGVWLFWNPPVLRRILADVLDNLLLWVCLLTISFIIVFLPCGFIRPSGRKRQNTK